MTDEKFYDLYKIEDEEEEEEEEETFEEQMLDRLGTRWEWESDAERKNACFSPAYKRFLENGCRGILTYEEAVEAYKFNTQVDPETVTSWPHLDWLKKHREGGCQNFWVCEIIGARPPGASYEHDYSDQAQLS